MPSLKRPLYVGKDVTAAELRHAARVKGLGDEIALVRVRLSKAIRAGTATDRFILQGVGILARLVLAQARAEGVDPNDAAAQATREAALRLLGALCDDGSPEGGLEEV